MYVNFTNIIIDTSRQNANEQKMKRALRNDASFHLIAGKHSIFGSCWNLFSIPTSCVANMDLIDGSTSFGGMIPFTVTYKVDG